MNINQSWLKEGYATFTYPAKLSPESAEWLLEWLELTQRQIKRHMEQDIADAENKQLISQGQQMSEEDATNHCIVPCS